MDPNENRFEEETETPRANRMSVRDRIRQYNTAIKTDSTKTSYSSVVSPKSSSSGINVNNNNQEMDNVASSLFIGTGTRLQEQLDSPSKSSCDSQKMICNTRSPRLEMPSDKDYVSLERQRSFMNLSRSREPPKAAPREKKPRRSMQMMSSQQMRDDDIHNSEASYQSKTTITKTPSGVRIIIDIFFDQNKGLSIEEVVGSRVETDIPPSKILSDFQKRIAESTRE